MLNAIGFVIQYWRLVEDLKNDWLHFLQFLQPIETLAN